MHDAGGDAAGQVQALHDVAGEDAEGKTVFAVGGELGRLVRGGERHDRGHRAEDLTSVSRHLRRDVGQHGRPVEQPLEGTAGGQPGPGVHAGGDQAVYLVALSLVDDGAERDPLGGRVADR